MSKFCGNCGYQAEDTDKICGNCGTPFEEVSLNEPVVAVEESAPVISIKQLDSEQKEKLKKIAVFAGAGIAAVVAIIVAIVIIVNSTGYKGLVNDIMDDFIEGKPDAIVENLSDLQLDMLDEYDMDEDTLADNLESEIDNCLDYLEEEVGDGCDYSYEIVETSELTERKVENFVEDQLGEYADDYEISAVMDVDIELTAEKRSKTETVTITIRFIDQDGWKFFDIDVDY